MSVVRTVPASVGQRLLGLMDHYRNGDASLAVPAFFRLRGPVERPALQAALDALVARHEALRSTYGVVNRRLAQHVHDHLPVQLEVVGVGVGDVGAALREAMAAQARIPFDLTVSPFRAVLIEIASEDAVLLLNVHHLSTDGWSGGVMATDLGRLYRPGAPALALGAPARQAADFSEWQRERFASGALATQQQFWRDRLAGVNPPRLAITPGAGSPTEKIPGTTVFELSDAAVAGIAVVCRSRRVTTFVVALALFASVLHAQDGDRDFGFASMFANRPRAEFAETMGFLANLLVLPLRLPADPTFGHILDAAQDIVFDALANQEVPYHLVPQVPGERGRGLENILFQVTAGPEYALTLDGLEVEQINPPGGIGTRFDVEFALMPGRTGIKGMVWYDAARYPQEWVEGLVRDFGALAESADPASATPIVDVIGAR